ncbi:hypothetical protein [Chondrinema litorale]|uniref:hypothetical protein n=1 Tax=Chondrinema litorale TaxID=2994555 RepID=UPI002542BAF6|nr:hypothetical protein [Chondrinema litorale]UZR99605.1 hypothetical protein OQ292_37080 [Chondrinema litorale]
MKKINLLFLLFCLTNLNSCFLLLDDLPELPEETKSGLDTFGMLLNDEVWEPSVPGILVPTSDTKGVIYNSDSKSMRFFAKNNSKENHEIIEFFIQDVNEEGVYEIKIKNSIVDEPSCTDSTRYNPNTNNSYDCEEAYKLLSNQSGIVNINFLDTINKIVAGTFEGELFNKNGQKISITEGRFDFEY